MAGFGGFRVGVVVVAAGLALLGPHAVVAAADAGDSAGQVAGPAAGPSGNPGQGAGSVGRRGSTPQRAAARTAAAYSSPPASSTPALSPSLRAVISDPASAPLVPAGRAVAAPAATVNPAAAPRGAAGRAVAAVGPARAASIFEPIPTASLGGAAGRAVAAAAPVPAASISRPTAAAAVGGAAVSSSPSAAFAPTVPSRAAAAAPAPAMPAATAATGRPLQSVVSVLDRVLASAANWLASLPTNPATTLLQGALDQIRRTINSTVGSWFKETGVIFVNKTDQALAVVQVPKGGNTDPGAAPVFIPVGGPSATFKGYNSTGPDVRLRVYSAYQDSSGTWHTGDMKEIIIASNSFLSSPYAAVLMDPFKAAGGKTENSAMTATFFSQGSAWHADYVLRGPIQTGQTRTYIERGPDAKDYKIFYVQAFEVPQGATEDYPTAGGGWA